MLLSLHPQQKYANALTYQFCNGSLCSAIQFFQFLANISFQIPVWLTRSQCAQVLQQLWRIIINNRENEDLSSNVVSTLIFHLEVDDQIWPEAKKKKSHQVVEMVKKGSSGMVLTIQISSCFQVKENVDNATTSLTGSMAR